MSDKKRVYIFKPLKDNRYDPLGQSIVTHKGYEMNSTPIESAEDILSFLNKRNAKEGVIAVDEAFMVEGIAEMLIDLYQKGFTILISTIQLSYHLQPFEEISKILPWATKIEVCPAVCTICGADAYYTHKKAGSNKEVEIGGASMYEPRCLKHHRE